MAHTEVVSSKAFARIGPTHLGGLVGVAEGHPRRSEDASEWVLALDGHRFTTVRETLFWGVSRETP